MSVYLEVYGAHSELNAPLGLAAAWWVPHAAPASHPTRELPAALPCPARVQEAGRGCWASSARGENPHPLARKCGITESWGWLASGQGVLG